ncbi:hypothetical protein TgHK011_002754 [Trichoderma gracile]|nr:hypothetical protein TgHK011_002754 [Trichoderma gracile]
MPRIFSSLDETATQNVQSQLHTKRPQETPAVSTPNSRHKPGECLIPELLFPLFPLFPHSSLSLPSPACPLSSWLAYSPRRTRNDAAPRAARAALPRSRHAVPLALWGTRFACVDWLSGLNIWMREMRIWRWGLKN